MKRGARREALLSLGSNAAAPAPRLRAALRELSRLPNSRLAAVSPWVRSSPVGVRGQRDYLNLCAVLETSLSPMGLLVELKRLEARAGRRPGPRWGPRPLDIDVLFMQTMRVQGRWLTIPHPRAMRRRFVLLPLSALKADWIPPIRPRRPLKSWLRSLRDPEQKVFAQRGTSQ